ncbi:MAG: hypothetical protein CO107_05145 [Deltaproteobacteria bacterium CG_4_9_14_3_um_filter_51_14]|nr:MAG: hypothetical protein CO107_05145 [Deltaproteobacteria bacterium CG_4_9_14_3_um_filter_51_14]
MTKIWFHINRKKKGVMDYPDSRGIAAGAQIAISAGRGGWWGDYRLTLGEAGRWRVGSTDIIVTRTEKEWRVSHDETGLPDALPDFSVEIPYGGNLSPVRFKRYCFIETNENLRLLPALADRFVVTRPFTPFYVLPNQEATIFASSPLWAVFWSLNPLRRMDEFPIIRPSDTWFGPSPMEGEFCYASRTNCFLSPEDLTLRSHRALTPVRIINHASDSLLLERINLPVTNLSLFAAPDGSLWTEQIVFERRSGSLSADIRIMEGPAAYAHGAELVCGPRERMEKNMMVKALSSIFG